MARTKRPRKVVNNNEGLCPKYKALHLGVLVTEGRHLFYHPENHPTAESPTRCIFCGRRPRLASDPEVPRG